MQQIDTIESVDFTGGPGFGGFGAGVELGYPWYGYGGGFAPYGGFGAVGHGGFGLHAGMGAFGAPFGDGKKGAQPVQYVAPPKKSQTVTQTLPVQYEKPNMVSSKPTYLPAQYNYIPSEEKQHLTKTYSKPASQTVLIKQPVVRPEIIEQPYIQPVITQPVVTRRIVTHPIYQPTLTTHQVVQPVVYTQPIYHRSLQYEQQTAKPTVNTQYETAPTETLPTEQLEGEHMTNKPIYQTLPAQMQQEGSKKQQGQQLPQEHM